jgi:hypothetical protein
VSALSLTNKQELSASHAPSRCWKITAVERTVTIVQERLQVLDKELAAAAAAASAETNKPKLQEKLERQRAKVLEREEKLTAIVPISPLPLKLQGDINKLRAEAVPLQKVQDAGAGRLLSVKESQTVSKLGALPRFVEQDRRWFEEDTFDAPASREQLPLLPLLKKEC